MSTPVFTVKEAQNGDIVAVGNNAKFNIIFKLNANGDSLLMKTIYYLEGNTCFFAQQYGFDLALIDSGGYAVAGFIIPSGANINNTQDAWLSTYDSLGCQLPTAPFNLTGTPNIVGTDTLINLSWQYNPTTSNEVFLLERYWNDMYVWRIMNGSCTQTLSGNTFITNTNFIDTASGQLKYKYRVLAVDTLTHLTSCYSNIAVVDLTVGIKTSNLQPQTILVYPNPNKGMYLLKIITTTQISTQKIIKN